jgi:hypothetical protein
MLLASTRKEMHNSSQRYYSNFRLARTLSHVYRSTNIPSYLHTLIHTKPHQTHSVSRTKQDADSIQAQNHGSYDRAFLPQEEYLKSPCKSNQIHYLLHWQLTQRFFYGFTAKQFRVSHCDGIRIGDY